MIYEDFENILLPEDNGKQNPRVLHELISNAYCLQLWL